MANATPWRSVVALIAAGAAVLGATASAHADEQFSFTAEKYSQIPFGTAQADVWEQLGGDLTKPGDGDGWCERSSASILCFTESADYAPYGTFAFTADGKLWGKNQQYLFNAKTPSIRLSHYNKVTVGMTEGQLWSVVPKDSCVLRQEAYPNWPATSGKKLMFGCTAATGLFPPNASFYLTDGKVAEKYQARLT